MIGIRTARERDVRVIAQVLAEAFADDPVIRWLQPDGHGRALLFRTLAHHVHAPAGCGDVAQRDGRPVGAALWDPPGHRPSTWQQLRSLAPLAFALRGRARYGQALETAFHEHRPPGRFWYLALLGAGVPGTGVGSALLRHRLDRILGPAYLESSNERNIALYERFGFRVTGKIQLPCGGPVCWSMYRD